MHQSFHSTPTWTFKSRTQTITSNNKPHAFPGPTNYNNEKPQKHFGTTTLGKQKRQVFLPLDGPSPSDYIIKSFISQGPKQTIASKHTNKQFITPSPQAYSPKFDKLNSKSPNYSIGNKQHYQWTNKYSKYEPSPSSYNPEIQSSRSRIKVGNSKRKDLSDYQNTPGPAAYNNTAQSLTLRLNPRITIGGANRKSLFDQTQDSPGPGKYVLKTSVDQDRNRNKGYTMRPLTADISFKAKSRIPGPGRYDIQRDKRQYRGSRGYSSGNGKRVTFIDNIMRGNKTPGPNSYIVKKKSQKAYSFSNSKRKNLSDFQNTPGPVEYDTLNNSLTLKTKAPGYSIGKQQKGKFLDKAFNIVEACPGPFNYNPNYSTIKQNSRMLGISKSKWRNQGKGLDSPGVGIYNLNRPTSSNGSKFTKQKRSSFTDCNFYQHNPSPAEYNTRGALPNPPKYMLNSSYVRK